MKTDVTVLVSERAESTCSLVMQKVIYTVYIAVESSLHKVQSPFACVMLPYSSTTWNLPRGSLAFPGYP